MTLPSASFYSHNCMLSIYGLPQRKDGTWAQLCALCEGDEEAWTQVRWEMAAQSTLSQTPSLSDSSEEHSFFRCLQLKVHASVWCTVLRVRQLFTNLKKCSIATCIWNCYHVDLKASSSMVLPWRSFDYFEQIR